jgi:hypothetical protein
MRIRTIVGTGFVVGALSAGAIAVHADEGNDRVEQTVIKPRSFTIPAGQCSQLPAGLEVQGLGLERTVTVVEGTASGDDRLTFGFTAKIDGTATDSAGGQYRFSYQLRFQRAARLPGTGIVVDTFALTRAGMADTTSVVSTLFRAKVTLDAASNPVGFEILEASGDPFHCDPL